MASVYDLKPAFQRLLQPMLDLLIRCNVTPNQITLAALALSIACGVMLVTEAWQGQSAWALLALPGVLFVRMALNALDGMLARTRQLSTPLGEILNETGDVIADIFLYFPLAFYVLPGWSFFAVIGFVMLSLLSEFCGLVGKSVYGERRYNGPMGKSDRALCIGLYTLCLFFVPPLVLTYSAHVFGVLDLLLILTCINRLRPLKQKAA